MAPMGRPGLSEAQKAELCHRTKHVQSLSEIGRALGKYTGSIHGIVSSDGRFSPTVRKRWRNEKRFRMASDSFREEVFQHRRNQRGVGFADGTVCLGIRRDSFKIIRLDLGACGDHVHKEKSMVRFDHTFIRISQPPLLIPSETTPDRLGFHSTIAAEEHLFPRGKSPRPFGEVLSYEFWILSCLAHYEM